MERKKQKTEKRENRDRESFTSNDTSRRDNFKFSELDSNYLERQSNIGNSSISDYMSFEQFKFDKRKKDRKA